MAYWVQIGHTSENGRRRGFICELASDVEDLPTQNHEGVKQENDNVSHHKCAYGSEAYVMADGSRYMLSKTSGQWEKLQGVTSSGGGAFPSIVGDGGVFLTISPSD